MDDVLSSQPTGAGLGRLVVKGSLLIGLVQGSIKLLGFVEKVLLGNVYGTDSPTYAAYLVSFEVFLVCSEVLRLSVIPSLVPMLEVGRRGDAADHRPVVPLTGRFGTAVVLLVVVGVTLPGLLFAGPLLRATFAREWLADPTRQESVGLMVLFLRLFMGGVVFTAAGVCTYALLNSHRRFGLAALGDLAFKVVGLGAFVFVAFALGLRERAIFGLAGGIVAGCVGFVTVHLIGLRRMGVLREIRPGLDLRDAHLRRTLALFAPLLLSVLIFNGRRLFDKLFASGMELADYVAAQDFAFRFIETPYRFLIEPFAIVLLPYLAALAMKRDLSAFRATAITSLRMLLVVFVPAAVGFYLLREPFIQVVLEHGRFDAVSTYLTCAALRWYIVGLTLWGLDVFLQRLYFAARETLRPTLFEVAAMAAYVALCLLWRSTLRHEGIALAFTLSRVVKVTLLGAFLRSKLGRLEWRAGGRFLGKLLAASAALGVPVYGIARALAVPPEVRIWAEAEGERFAYQEPDGPALNGRQMAAQQGLADAVLLAAGASATLLLVAPETDHYTVWLRIRSASSADAVVTVTIDPTSIQETTGATWAWRRLATGLPLQAGLHRVRIETRDPVEVDALVLVNAAVAEAGFAPDAAERPEAGVRGVVAIGVAGSRGRRLLTLVAAAAVGLLVYLLALRLLRVEELGRLRALIRRRPV